MILTGDERVQKVKCVSIRYSYLIEILLIVISWILSMVYGDIMFLQPKFLFGSKIYYSFSLNQNVSIIISTQLLVLFGSEALFNKILGGKSEPLVSGTNKFRRMDERESVVSDKAVFITYLYINCFFVIWAVIDVITRKELGVSFTIVILQFIIYNIIKAIEMKHYGEKIQ